MVPGKYGGKLRVGNPGPRDTEKAKAIKAIRKNLPGAVEALVRAAEEGESWAVVKMLEYGIGKPTEKLEVTGDGGGPVLLSPVLASISDEKLQAELKRLEEDMKD